MGRFLSPDWAAQEEPVPYAQMDDPQSLNLYAYVQNNPLRNIDSDGHLLHNAFDGMECAGEGSIGCSPEQQEQQQQQQAPQQIGQDPTLPTAVQPPSPSSFDLFMGILWPQTPGEAANMALTVGTDGLGELGGAGVRLASGLLGKADSYAELSALAEKGDAIVAHHMPQAALGFTSKAEGGALAITSGEHVATRTYGFKGAMTAIADAGKSFREVLANDIRDIRSIAGSKYNEGLKSLIQYYRTNFPNLMSK